jgi:alpha-beta hydrolase superfamily lysophospholipase
MAYNEQTLELTGGGEVYTWWRREPGAIAQVVLVHGFGEHSGRYHPLTDFLCSRGFNVCSFDQRGHGRSSGLYGHIDRFGDYEDDLRRVVAMAKAHGPAPLFLIGHSMGGLITLRYLAGNPSGIAGAVVSAPLLGFAVRIPRLKLAIGRASALIAPKMRMANEINPANLSRDPEVGRAYAEDPLVRRVVSARWFSEATRAMESIRAAVPSITAPVLILHGTQDRLAAVDATRAVFGLIGSRDKQLKIYPGFYHELFNEPEKQDIFQTVGDWLSARLRSSPVTG